MVSPLWVGVSSHLHWGIHSASAPSKPPPLAISGLKPPSLGHFWLRPCIHGGDMSITPPWSIQGCQVRWATCCANKPICVLRISLKLLFLFYCCSYSGAFRIQLNVSVLNSSMYWSVNKTALEEDKALCRNRDVHDIAHCIWFCARCIG